MKDLIKSILKLDRQDAMSYLHKKLSTIKFKKNGILRPKYMISIPYAWEPIHRDAFILGYNKTEKELYIIYVDNSETDIIPLYDFDLIDLIKIGLVLEA